MAQRKPRTSKESRGRACPYAGGSPAKAYDGSVPNKVFAKTDDAFKDACQKANVEPTARQASKFRNGKGSAYAK